MPCRHGARRLWLQVFAAIVLMLFVAAFSVGTITWVARGREFSGHLDRGLAALATSLPPEGDPTLQRDLDALAEALEADLTLRAPGGPPVVQSGPQVPPGPPGWWHDHGRAGVRLPLRDGRELGLAWRHGPERNAPFFIGVTTAGLVLAMGAWWIARRITRRLELVQVAMRAWGDGDLSARVPVMGADEVAAVATAFNTAAERVHSMVDAHRRTLASVSHELRSPLARLRMAMELLEGPPELREEAVRDIEELDATVGELLQVGRLQAVGVQRREPVDLRALLEDEARHTGAAVSGPPTVVPGDPALLRRLVRNLLDNARRHAGGAVEATSTPDGLVVSDRGPGVRDAHRIFEPFYRDVDHAEGRDGGVGLGLWLVREIARQHGGDVRWEARDGGGSRFVVTLKR